MHCIVVQVTAVGAILGLFVLYIANKVFDWGLFGRPVYLIDIFCFRPPERYVALAAVRLL